MKKKVLTIEQQLGKYKRRSRILAGLLGFFIAAAAWYIYLNYDYLAFKHFFTQFYIYTGTLDELYKSDLKLDANGHYYSHFDDFVISTVTKRIREANGDKYTYLYTPEKYEQSLEDEKNEALQSEVRIIDSSTAYIRITNFSKYTRDFLYKNIEKLKTYPRLVIDLRDNLGGDSEEMNRMAGYFLPKKSVISVDSLRILDWTYKAGREGSLKLERIGILQNKNSASASENFIAALKDNLNNVTLFGASTFGKGIGQFTLPLKGGFAVKATILKWYTPAGINIQGKGIAPDIAYTGDDILDFAVRKLAEP